MVGEARGRNAPGRFMQSQESSFSLFSLNMPGDGKNPLQITFIDAHADKNISVMRANKR